MHVKYNYVILTNENPNKYDGEYTYYSEINLAHKYASREILDKLERIYEREWKVYRIKRNGKIVPAFVIPLVLKEVIKQIVFCICALLCTGLIIFSVIVFMPQLGWLTIVPVVLELLLISVPLYGLYNVTR